MLTKLRKLLSKLAGLFKRYFNSLFKVRSKKTIAITAIAAVFLAVILVANATPTAPQSKGGRPAKKANKNPISHVFNNLTGNNNTNQSSNNLPSRTDESGKKRTTRTSQRTENLRDRVERSVKTNRLSQDKANLIYAKLDELDKFLDDANSKPSVERHRLISEKEKELYKWAKENNISRSYVRI